MASMVIDTQEDYFELAEKMRATGMLDWQEVLGWQKALDNSPANNNSIVWMIVPSQQILNNPAKDEYISSLAEDEEVMSFDTSSTYFWTHNIENLIEEKLKQEAS